MRDELYRRMAVNDALRILAARFPDGTAIELWSRVPAQARLGDDRIAMTIDDRILGEHLPEARPAPSISRDEA